MAMLNNQMVYVKENDGQLLFSDNRNFGQKLGWVFQSFLNMIDRPLRIFTFPTKDYETPAPCWQFTVLCGG